MLSQLGVVGNMMSCRVLTYSQEIVVQSTAGPSDLIQEAAESHARLSRTQGHRGLNGVSLPPTRPSCTLQSSDEAPTAEAHTLDEELGSTTTP